THINQPVEGRAPRPSMPGGDARLSTGKFAILLRIPLQQPHFDSSSFQPFLEYGEIGTVVVIRNYDLRVERLHRIRRLFRRHGVGKIHANECHVNVLKRAHFRYAFRVTGEVETYAAIGEHVSVAASFVMEELAR